MFFKTAVLRFCTGGFCLLCLILSPVFGQQAPRNVLDKIHFRSIGPTKQSGRFMQVGVPDTDKQPYTFYAAASTGGLWKTTDNGITYQPIFDNENINALGDVEVAFSDPEIVYLGTGNLSYWGEGMYKSTDGGESWTHIGLEDSYFISKIVIHPENPDLVYVSAVGSPYDNKPERGIFKTSNGGRTWEKVLGLTDNGKHLSGADVHMHPTDFKILYASMWDRDGGEASGIFKTTNGGSSWDKLGGGLPTVPLQRIGLDIYRTNPDVVVATILITVKNPENPRRDTENTIWRTRDAGRTWQRISPDLKTFLMRGSERYAQVRIDPNNEDKIYVLNSGIQGTDDGGKTWKHAIIRFGNDHQDLWINPLNSDHMIGSSDSGIRISFSGCKTWYHPDNLPCGLLEAVGVDMAYPYNVYGGMQDFGTWRGPSTKQGRYPIRFEDWEHVGGADGGYAQVDPRDNRWLFVSSQNGSISRNDQKTNVRKGIRYRKEGIRFNFVAPFLISPHNPNVIFHGANVLLRSSYLGECWKEISPDLTNGPYKEEKNRINGTITTLDESPIVQGVIWVGTDDGNVQLTRDGGKSWTKLNDNIPGKPEYKVSRVEASRHDPAEGFITLNGRRITGDLKPYVYRTTDYGETWESITSGLPDDEPVNVIRHDHKNPDLLFLGTEKSVYVSLDRGESWQSLRNNMPNIPVTDMVIHTRENDLGVATYGRSFWIADISPLQEINLKVLAKNVHLFDVEPQVLWTLSGQKQVAANFQNYDGENAPKGIVVNYYLKNRVNGGVTVQIFRGSLLINEYEGSGDMGLNSVEWHLTERIPRTDTEKEDAARGIERTRNEQLFFDYYDGHDYFGEPDEEVSVTGRSLEIWIQPQPEWWDVDYKHIRAKPGEYTVKLIVNGEEYSKKALVLKDQWYENRY
jgi:photosystem II stability/assembly factor-like uncharacterized protein